MGTIFQSTLAHSLVESLDTIVDDDMDKIESTLIYPQWCEEGKMDGAYEDDLEMGGPGLATEKPEGTEMQTGTIQEGALTRYWARTFALKLLITEEALEDGKYPKAINLARRLKRAMWKTIDIDATNILIRAWNTNYIGGDGLCLANAAHTLPGGGTWSNTMATPMAPSRAAMIIATTAIYKYPGHDGVTEGYRPKCIVCPVDQWAVWAGIVKSTHAPEPGAFNEVNVVNSELDPDVVPIKYWSNTTTNWGVITDNDAQINFKFRKRPTSNTFVDQAQLIMNYGIYARWARLWSDPRCFFGVQA